MNSKPTVANPTLLALGDLLKTGESVKRVAGDGINALDAWVTANAPEILGEAYRRICRDALRLYRALPAALEFHRSELMQRILCGSNQSGKTSAGVAEVARIVLGRHPLFPVRDGITLCVGLDDNHLAQNMWKELSSEGAFDCIMDGDTGLPRAVRSNPSDPYQLDPYDAAHQAEWFPSPPFIPTHEWDWEDGIAWRDRQVGSPAVVHIKSTNWTMLWHPSGGNPRRGIKINCLAGWSYVYDPVAKRHRRIDQIKTPFHVLSVNECTGKTEIRRASKPFIKGRGEIICATLSNGRQIFTTREHRVLASNGRWLTMQQAYSSRAALVYREEPECLSQSSNAGPMRETCRSDAQFPRCYPTGTSRRVPRLASRGVRQPTTAVGCDAGCDPTEMASTQDYRDRYSPYSRLCDARPQLAANSDRSFFQEPVDVPVPAPLRWHEGDPGRRPTNTQPYLSVSQSAAGSEPCHAALSVAIESQLAPMPERPQGIRSKSASVSRRQSSPCRNTTPALSLGPEFSASSSCLQVSSIVTIGHDFVWDISVECNENYIHGCTVSHNCAWFDEETSKEWFFETVPRLMRRNGRFIWTATPQTGNEELMQLMQAADEGSEFVGCWTLLIENNPYIPEVQKRIAYETYQRMSDEDLEVRWFGRSAMLGRKVYPQYDPRKMWVGGFE